MSRKKVQVEFNRIKMTKSNTLSNDEFEVLCYEKYQYISVDLLEKYKARKYLTKELKYSLMKLGFEYKEKYLNTNDAQDYVTRSKQIDIIDRKILRIGLGKDKLYTCRWLEVPVVL